MSIALTTPYTVSIGGTQVEDDTTGGCSAMTLDYLGHIMTYTFKVGTLTGSPPQLNVGPYAQLQGQSITVTVNLSTGAWSDNIGGMGTIPGSILNPIITQIIANRNSAEGFVAVSGGLMPGTTTAWTQL
jgi:hypothetical protein